MIGLVYFLAGFVIGFLVIAIISGSKSHYNKGYEDDFTDCFYLWENGKLDTNDENEII